MSASDTKIPRFLLPFIGAACAIGMAIVAATNTEALIAFGNKLYGDGLDWSLPALCIGYEFVATIVWIFTPKGLPDVRRSAARGAAGGFFATVILAILWALIAGGAVPEGLWLKVFMKPFPSLIALGIMHTFVLVWKAVKGSAEQQLDTPASETEEPVLPAVLPGPTPEEIAAIVARQVEAAFAEFSAELRASMDKRPPAKPAPRPIAKRPVAAPAKPISAAPVVAPVATLPSLEEVEIGKQEDALALFQEELAALPEAPSATPDPGNCVNLEHLSYTELKKLLPSWLSADPEHIELAKTFVREAGDAHEDIKSGKILKHFGGIGDRQVRNALRIAKIQMGLKALPAMTAA